MEVLTYKIHEYKRSGDFISDVQASGLQASDGFKEVQNLIQMGKRFQACLDTSLKPTKHDWKKIFIALLINHKADFVYVYY